MTYSELNEMTISDLQNLNSMVVQTINNKRTLEGMEKKS